MQPRPGGGGGAQDENRTQSVHETDLFGCLNIFGKMARRTRVSCGSDFRMSSAHPMIFDASSCCNLSSCSSASHSSDHPPHITRVMRPQRKTPFHLPGMQ